MTLNDRGILLETGALALSVWMLRSSSFRKNDGLTGVATPGLDLLSSIPGMVLAPLKIAITMLVRHLYILWFLLVGIRFSDWEDSWQRGRASAR